MPNAAQQILTWSALGWLIVAIYELARKQSWVRFFAQVVLLAIALLLVHVYFGWQFPWSRGDKLIGKGQEPSVWVYLMAYGCTVAGMFSQYLYRLCYAHSESRRGAEMTLNHLGKNPWAARGTLLAMTAFETELSINRNRPSMR